jgi:predicted nucleic acid-binding protein
VKLVVDACVAVKWFVAEEGQAEALAILERGDECFAPDLLLVEVAGVLDKKVKAGAVTRDQALEAVTAVQSQMTMVAGTRLIKSALDLASELTHPVADCLYLACAIELDARVVTADKVFAARAHAKGYLNRLVLLGTEIDNARAAPIMTNLQLEELQSLLLGAQEVFLSVEKQVRVQIDEAFGLPVYQVAEGARKPAVDSPAYVKLKRHLHNLTVQQRKFVTAVCWFGRDGREGQQDADWATYYLNAIKTVDNQPLQVEEVIKILHFLHDGIENLNKLTIRSKDR